MRPYRTIQGWEVAYDPQIGPYIIDHASWKTYLPEEVPTQWLSHLSASYGRTNHHKPPQRQKVSVGTLANTTNATPAPANSLSPRKPSSKKAFNATPSRAVKASSRSVKPSSRERAADTVLAGKLMKQMQVLHSELVDARKHNQTTTEGEGRFTTTVAAAADREMSVLSAKRTAAEAAAAEQQLEFVACKARINTRNVVAVDGVAALDGKENAMAAVATEGSADSPEAALDAVRELASSIRQQCRVLGAE
jgi:Tfp pilus assembly protein PilV